MSANGSAALPTDFDRFRQIYHLDFEYQQDENLRPVPVAMFVREHRSGDTIGPLNRAEMEALRAAPFDTGPDSLMTAYNATAELACLAMLRWPPPQNIVCLFVETMARINGHVVANLGEKRQ